MSEDQTKVNVSEKIRSYVGSDKKPAAIVEELASQGIVVKANYVSAILTKARKAGGAAPGKRGRKPKSESAPVAAPVAAPVSSFPAVDSTSVAAPVAAPVAHVSLPSAMTVDCLRYARDFVRAAGGLDCAKTALSELESLQA